jgi:hypothetical protein
MALLYHVRGMDETKKPRMKSDPNFKGKRLMGQQRTKWFNLVLKDTEMKELVTI